MDGHSRRTFLKTAGVASVPLSDRNLLTLPSQQITIRVKDAAGNQISSEKYDVIVDGRKLTPPDDNQIRLEEGKHTIRLKLNLSPLDRIKQFSRTQQTFVVPRDPPEVPFRVAKNAEEYWQLVTEHWGYKQLGLNQYHKTTCDYGEGRRVLAIVTGFDTTHPLYNPVWKGKTHKPYHVNIHGVHPEPASNAEINDSGTIATYGHGTAVIGGVWQAAPNAEFYIARAEGNLADRIGGNFLGAFEYARQNADKFDVVVTSQRSLLSLLAGFIDFAETFTISGPLEQVCESTGDVVNQEPVCSPSEHMDQWLESQANAIAGSDTLFVAAAGNKGEQIPAEHPEPPSTASEAISVASLKNRNAISRLNSPINPLNGKPDLAAPGVGIKTLVKPGKGDVLDHKNESVPKKDVWDGLDIGVKAARPVAGSSIAAPLVAGVGTILSKYETGTTLKQILENTANQIPGTNLDGSGRVSLLDAFDRAYQPGTSEVTATETKWPATRGGPSRTGTKTDATGPQSPLTEKWKFTEATGSLSSPAVADNTIYVGGDASTKTNPSQNVYAIDANTGTRRWEFSEPTDVTDSPIIACKTVYVGTGGGDTNVYAIDVDTGTKRWQFEGAAAGITGLAIDGATLYVTSDDDTLYALNIATGTKQWQFDLPHGYPTAPVVMGDRVYVASDTGNGGVLYGVAVPTGKTQWRYDRSAEWMALAGTENTIYVGSRDGTVAAIDAATHEERWYVTDQQYQLPDLAVRNGFVYLTSVNLYALDAPTGEKQWQFSPPGDFNLINPPAVTAERVYVTDDRGKIYVLDATTGDQRRRHTLDTEIKSSPAVADEILYTGSTTGTVVALKETESENIQPVEFLGCSTVRIHGSYTGVMFMIDYLGGPYDASEYLYDKISPVSGTTTIDASEYIDNAYIDTVWLSKDKELNPNSPESAIDHESKNPHSFEQCEQDRETTTEDEDTQVQPVQVEVKGCRATFTNPNNFDVTLSALSPTGHSIVEPLPANSSKTFELEEGIFGSATYQLEASAPLKEDVAFVPIEQDTIEIESC